ncbi:hypothetical protein [Corynebacterium mayonis]|uniref:hypothetical protein n=1 Tax=Corynebacterium mayonis TaxID=3062461 RepID=UPI0031402808
MRSRVWLCAVGVPGCFLLASCAARVEVPEPESVEQVEQFSVWAAERSEPYGVPERALRSYAFAAWTVQQESGCQVGWPTMAALGKVLSDHGEAQGSQVAEDGVTTVALRGLGTALGPEAIVADTDGGETDGDSTRDVPVGPMQIMPSRWEQFRLSTEPGKEPNPDDIDDAALTMASIVCKGGDLSTPEGWDRGMISVVDDMEKVKEIHRVSKEFSR